MTLLRVVFHLKGFSVLPPRRDPVFLFLIAVLFFCRVSLIFCCPEVVFEVNRGPTSPFHPVAVCSVR